MSTDYAKAYDDFMSGWIHGSALRARHADGWVLERNVGSSNWRLFTPDGTPVKVNGGRRVAWWSRHQAAKDHAYHLHCKTQEESQ